MAIKNLKTILASTIASAFIACASPTDAQDLSFNGRFNYAPRYHSLNLNESKTIPVHPADASFLSGNTDVKAGSAPDLVVLDLGLEARYGKKEGFNIFGGVDLELDLGVNQMGYSSAGDRQDWGMYSSKQQSSDTRPESTGSFVYDKLEQDTFSLIPFLGVGYKFENYSLDFEYGLHSRKFKREWGHERSNNEESVGSENYDSLGNRFSIKLGIGERVKDQITLQLMYEDYSLKKSDGSSAGKLGCYSLGVGCKF
jgi:hypothetical protein